MTDLLEPTHTPTTTPAARPARLTVIADHRPGRHHVDTDEIGWWLPIIGPTSACLARTLAHRSREGEHEWVTADLARRIGLGASCSKLWLSLDRLDRFGCMTFVSTDIATIRLFLPALTPNQLAILPADMAEAYRARFGR